MIFKNGHEYVPISGLDLQTHLLIYGFLIPIIISIIVVIVFPKLFAPLFLKLKGLIYWRYKNAYIKKTNTILTKKVFFKRGLYLVLFTMGLYALISPNIDYSLFLTQESIKNYQKLGINPVYSLTVVGIFIGILFPISLGFWSVGWALEDAGLMHYKIQDERKGKELYEIEPIYLKYTNYLKGYAGISSIIFVIQISMHFIAVGGEYISDAFLIIIILFTVFPLIIPAYLAYAIIMGENSYLRKNLKEIKKFSEEDILN
ncbi:MAG: hypothetical protein ACTSQP_09690 [Promethearchaeota archaeon]